MIRFVLSLLALSMAVPCLGQSPEPLPIDVALALRGHNGRSPVNASPDGAWVAHTIEAVDTVPRGTSRSYSATGFPFAEGNSRMEATLSALGGGRSVRLGSADASSWAPVWSPRGDRVAFYSDQDGEAGLWIWERATATARRIGDFVARPFFGFEGPRWTPDGAHLVVKVLPAGLGLAEANALLPAPGQERSTSKDTGGAPSTDPEEPTVVIRRSSALVARERSATENDGDGLGGPPGADPTMAFIRGNAVDLAIVEVATGSVQRIVEGAPVRWTQVAPDGRSLVYSVLTSFVPTAQQGLYELRRYDLESGASSVLARDVKLAYGVEWSWSPDSTRVAYTESGQQGGGGFVVIDARTGTTRLLENDAPSFAPEEGEIPPIWSSDGESLYGVGGGLLWQVDARIGATTGSARKVAEIDGWAVRLLVRPSWYQARAFSQDGERTLWVVAVEDGTQRQGLFSVVPSTAGVSLLHAEEGSWGFVFSGAATDAGDIIYRFSNQKQMAEIWATNVQSGSSRQVSSINADLDGYRLGEARVIEWKSANGDALRGALLLPPGAAAGSRLPMVVWVYGGATGSSSVHRFGLWGSMATFNMHLLATRGYAVLYPDAPIRTGHLTDDLVATVLPGVDAAIEQGFADPERLAVMGQSFGSINVLALLTRTERFRAAIITAAVLHPDLAADYLRSIGYYEQGQGNMGGSLWEHPERYRRNSPLFDFPSITTPILIGQGELDGDGVPSEAIYTALERLGKEVELRVYGGESHVISRPANVHDFWQRRLAFLADRLGLHVDEMGRVSVP